MAVNCKDQADKKEIYTTKKPRFKVPITNISNLIAIMRFLLTMPSFPTPGLNKYLVNIGNKFRPGMNAAALTARVIDRKSEAGIPTTPLPSGAENIDLKMERIRMEEIVSELTTKAKITATIDFQSLNILTKGSPYTQQGGNIDVGGVEGVIS
jgi:hypothetical protein